MDILILSLYLRLEFVKLSWFNKSFCKILVSLFGCFSVTKSCLTLCSPMNCSRPGFPVLHYLPEFAQTHVSDAIQPSHPLFAPFFSCPQSFPASGSFSVSWLSTSGGQSIRGSASAPVLPMSIQGWFALGLTVLLAVQGTLQESSPAPQFKSISSLALSLFMVQLSHPHMTTTTA